jgi:hypothetical protein
MLLSFPRDNNDTKLSKTIFYCLRRWHPFVLKELDYYITIAISNTFHYKNKYFFQCLAKCFGQQGHYQTKLLQKYALLEMPSSLYFCNGIVFIKIFVVSDWFVYLLIEKLIYYYFCYYYYHYFLYARHLYLYSWDKLCP